MALDDEEPGMGATVFCFPCCFRPHPSLQPFLGGSQVCQKLRIGRIRWIGRIRRIGQASCALKNLPIWRSFSCNPQPSRRHTLCQGDPGRWVICTSLDAVHEP